MKKHRAQYRRLMTSARAASKEGLFREAVKAALSSWDHIDGMMQYERRFEDKEFASIEGIDLILRYTPLLLDFESLDRLESLLKDFRRIDRHTSESLADKLAKARSLMKDAHRMWDYVEHHPEVRQDTLSRSLGGEESQWRSTAEAWEKMGLLRRTPEDRSYRLTLVTRMGEIVSGKCPDCGAVADAPKAMFLEELACPDCRAKALFVILSQEALFALRSKEATARAKE